MDEALDAIVVGAGPAGLAAALTLGRSRRRTLVLDTGDPRNAPADEMHNFFSRDGEPPAQVRAIAREQIAAYPTVEFRDVGAVKARAEDDGFVFTLADGTTARARRVLLATGLADELPQIPGLDELWGKSVFHCPYCHGYELAGQSVGVVGAAPHTVKLALQLTRLAGPIAVLANGGELDGGDGAKLAQHDVAIHADPIARVHGRDGRLEAVEFADGERLDLDALYVSPKLSQRSDLAKQLGCARFEDDLVEVDELGRTSVPGVFAAGDMARRSSLPGPAAAVIAAAASGTMAAAALDQDLVAAQFGLPALHAPERAAVPAG